MRKVIKRIWKEKPRIAFFDFACCEGCQLTVLELEEKLLDLLEIVEITTWREAMSSEGPFDIAFCEGSITRTEDIERLQNIRKNASILVSLGACASIGCHNALKNDISTAEAVEIVYGPGFSVDSFEARPITAVTDVDYQIRGCPVSLSEFITVFKRILTGKTYTPPNDPVCVECKRNDNLCVLEKGLICLGPVTRCGCNAICTAFGDPCQGCRGLVDNANLHAAVQVLTSDNLHPVMKEAALKNGLSVEDIRRKFAVYNNWPVLDLKEDADG